MTRDGKGKITDVADGIVFPILAALSVFVEERKNGWELVDYPEWDEKDDVFLPLKECLKGDSVNGNPWNLGKHRDSWKLMFNHARKHKRLVDKVALGQAH